MTGLDPRLFTDIVYDGNTYTRFDTAVESDALIFCPDDTTPLIAVYEDAMKKARHLLVIGEGSIGKTTNLRILEAYLLSQGVPTYLVECTNLNSESSTVIQNQLIDYPKETVILIDAWDEIPYKCRDAALRLVESFHQKTEVDHFRIVITSRFDPMDTIEQTSRLETNVFRAFERSTILPFSPAQVDDIVSDLGENRSVLISLLSNTMLFACYLDLCIMRATDGLRDVQNCGQFLLYYFETMVASKDERDAKRGAVQRWLSRIGERIYNELQLPQEKTNSEPIDGLPESLASIFEQYEENGNWKIRVKQIRHGAFCLGAYILSLIFSDDQLPNRDFLTVQPEKDIIIYSKNDLTEALVFAGELIADPSVSTVLQEILLGQHGKIDGIWAEYLPYVLLGTTNRVFNDIDFPIPYIERCIRAKMSFFDANPHVHRVELHKYHWIHGRCFTDVRDIWVADNHPTIFESDGCLFTHDHSTLLACFFDRIPSFFNDPVLKTISHGAFMYCKRMTSVIAPYVISVGNEAFRFCQSLDRVSLLQAETVGDRAFGGCNFLEEAELPSAINIGNSAFEDCWFLSKIRLPLAVAIGEGAFANVFLMENIDFPLVKSVGKNAFSGDFSLNKVFLPDVETIGENAFSFCTDLETVELPNAKMLDNWAFEYCLNLSRIALPCIEHIRDYVFLGCKKLEEVEFRDMNVDRLSNTVPNTKKCFGQFLQFISSAFLRFHRKSESCPPIGKGAFKDCIALRAIRFNGTIKQWNFIPKGENWDCCTPNYTVYCSDGTITKEGIITYYDV